MLFQPFRPGVYIALATLVAATAAPAQVVDWVAGGATTDYADPDNWSVGAIPSNQFDELVVIGSGALPSGNTTVATVTTDIATSTKAPTIRLGDGAGFEGTLTIDSGGRLELEPVSSIFLNTAGNLDVGAGGGVGLLNVTGAGELIVGGTLTTPISGSAASTIALSGNANVTAGALSLNHQLSIVGPNVTLQTPGLAILGSGTHEWAFDTATQSPSPLLVGGALTLGGVLKLDTLGGPLGVGESYTIADSASVGGAFTGIDLSDAPPLGLGVSLRTESAASGSSVNGVLTSVVVEQQPVLFVDRQTGEVRIEAPGADATTNFDVYVVGSDQGGLNPAAFDGIGTSEGWQKANPTATALSELNPLGSTSIAAGQSVSLGAAFTPPALAFGEATEDVTFRFDTGGGLIDGVVVYEGIPTDNLTLNIDRTSGEAQILNGFRDAVAIDGYLITSDSDSLDNGVTGWDAIGGDWQVTLAEMGRLSELNPLATLELATGEAQPLGNPFAIGGTEDLVFQFLLPGESDFRTGRVVFDDELTNLNPLVPGDFNADGRVDNGDLNLLLGNWGNPTVPGDWVNGFVAPVDNGELNALLGDWGVGTGNAIPEPVTLLTMAVAASLLRTRRR